MWQRYWGLWFLVYGLWFRICLPVGRQEISNRLSSLLVAYSLLPAAAISPPGIKKTGRMTGLKMFLIYYLDPFAGILSNEITCW
jgi:hypothetical protein